MHHASSAPGKNKFSKTSRVSRRNLTEAINMLTPFVPTALLPGIRTLAQQLAMKRSSGPFEAALVRTPLQMMAVREGGDRLGFLAVYLEMLYWESRLQALGDDAQLANVDLQNMLQRQQQTLQMMSNISKMLYDTAQSVIRKMGG
jgi:hypothetical protein